MGRKAKTATDKGGRHTSERGKGCGTLEKRGGLYRARITIDGKTYTRATGCSSKTEALKKLEEFKATFALKEEKKILEALKGRLESVDEQIKRQEDAKPALGIMAGWSAYVNSPSRPDSGAATMRQYELQYFVFADWLKANYPKIKELRHVTPEMVEAFMRDFGSTHSANTYNKYITLLRRVWKVLYKKARLTCNPWEDIQSKTCVMHSRRELTIDELHRVINAVEGEMRVLFAVGVYTGLRLGDCALLDWGSVDLARGFVSVVPRKTMRHSGGKPVKIPLLPQLADILAETPKSKRTGYVMPEMAELYQRDKSSLTDKIQSKFKRCGIVTHTTDENGRARVDVGFHSLRHTFVSLAASAGVPLAIVQAIVGHTSPAMTRHYTHVGEQALTNYMQAFPDIMAGRSGSGAQALADNSKALPNKSGDDPAQAVETRNENGGDTMAAFRNVWEKMSNAERIKALNFIAGASVSTARVGDVRGVTTAVIHFPPDDPAQVVAVGS